MTSTDQWIARVQADSLSRLEAVAQMQRELEGLVGEATTQDRTIAVTVTPTGALTALRISDEASALGGDRLAAAILDCVHRATAQAAGRMKEIVGAVLPEQELDAMLAGGVSPAVGAEVDAELVRRRAGGLG